MDVMAQNDRNQIVRKKILDLHDVFVGKISQDSPWLKSVRLHFTQGCHSKNWDVIKIHDSAIPAVYYTFLPEKQDVIDVERYPATLELTSELCAGIVDKDKSLVEIARDELKEECGYEAPASAFKQITTFLSISRTSAKETIFYVEVTDDMQIHPGGGDESEGEIIELVELSIPELKDYIKLKEVQSPANFLYGVSWFLLEKSEYC